MDFSVGMANLMHIQLVLICQAVHLLHMRYLVRRMLKSLGAVEENVRHMLSESEKKAVV